MKNDISILLYQYFSMASNFKGHGNDFSQIICCVLIINNALIKECISNELIKFKSQS